MRLLNKGAEGINLLKKGLVFMINADLFQIKI
jgi:hypothetical protein